ncbi:N-acetylglucosamine-6-phosphate deacetylase [Homoserinimonas sp. OAct 916]|uniref:N-acetylglucosamine-6-phosphate deacetylase n=1 Tax=Homoserinimonas sp. OAct 916 TaxID=2211450 RepID=UPI000DBE9BD8|nr:N-acetylglucosamine-6-phosphate deacetylase [Homoserinimonas sp. OAct 916]
MPTLIHSARLVSGGVVTDNAWVIFDGDRIVATGVGEPPIRDTEAQHSVPDMPGEVIDAAGRFLSPGFIDIHCHGGGGSAFDDGAEAIQTALALHRSRGTTRSVLSLVTAPLDALAQRLATIAELTATDPLVLGAHLEGPFLDPGHKGAHNPSLLRTPDAQSIELLLEAGEGALVQMTIAPELPGGLDAVRQLVDAGVVVAIGHTDVDLEQARVAFDAGASILTHAFNGMNGIHHRAPGPIVAAMHDAHVTLEIIADGVHLHPDMTRLAFAGAPGRIALVTDAMAAAGMGDGEYLLGELRVTVRGGRARLVDGDSIAGSTLTMDAALRHAVTAAGIDVGGAVQALTETPARAIGRAGDLGTLAAGYAADAVLLDETLNVDAVWAAGRRLR